MQSDESDAGASGSGLLGQPAWQALDEEHARRLAEIFKALGDPTRVKLLHALLHGELTVSELTRHLAATDDITLSGVSHQLRLLRSLRIVRDRREGKLVYYALDDDHIALILQQSLDHIVHGEGA